jgi:hypothetical protein
MVPPRAPSFSLEAPGLRREASRPAKPASGPCAGFRYQSEHRSDLGSLSEKEDSWFDDVKLGSGYGRQALLDGSGADARSA